MGHSARPQARSWGQAARGREPRAITEPVFRHKAPEAHLQRCGAALGDRGRLWQRALRVEAKADGDKDARRVGHARLALDAGAKVHKRFQLLGAILVVGCRGVL